MTSSPGTAIAVATDAAVEVLGPDFTEFEAAVALAEELAMVVAFERVIRRAQAEQFRRIEAARAMAAIVDEVTESSTSTEREFANRSFMAELATTMVVPEATAAGLVADASRLAGPRAATLDALAAGAVSAAHVRTLLEVTRGLPAEIANELEATALSDAGARTSAGFRRRVHRLRERLHPEPLAERRARSAEERRVVLETAPDGMAWLSLFLEAEHAVAIVERLGRIAQSGDPSRPDIRTRAQRSADVATDLLLAGALDGADRYVAAATGRVAAHVVVTVPVLSLLGVTDEPAELDGYGPIDADTARRLAAHAPSLHRLLVHPETGAALSYGRSTYRAGADLAGYLQVRDGGCRFPGCARRARHADLDHTVAWAHGGPTDASNMAHLCRAHHRLKHKTGWRMTHEPGGVIRWTSPAGHVLRTHPERPFIPVPAGTAATTAPAREHITVTHPPDPAAVHPDDPPWLHATPAAG